MLHALQPSPPPQHGATTHFACCASENFSALPMFDEEHELLYQQNIKILGKVILDAQVHTELLENHTPNSFCELFIVAANSFMNTLKVFLAGMFLTLIYEVN